MFYSFVKGLAKVILGIFYRIRAHGLENVPLEGKLIICSNHASAWDPIFISIAFPRQISWMGKKELFKNKLLAAILSKLTVFPVDRDGSDLSAIRTSLRLLKNEGVLGLFPEGTRVKEFDLDNAKSGVAMLGIRSGAPILPIYIEGNYKIFSKINIYIGKTIDLSNMVEDRPSNEDYLNMSKHVLSIIYSLKPQEEINEGNHS